jgi:hypothetical protein
MTILKDRIVEELDRLPESSLREVLSFVEFLGWRTAEPDEPLLAIAGALSGDMLSAPQIEEDLY